jgi:hypothetical protein
MAMMVAVMALVLDAMATVRIHLALAVMGRTRNAGLAGGFVDHDIAILYLALNPADQRGGTAASSPTAR